MNSITSGSLHRHMPEPVTRKELAKVLAKCLIGNKAAMRWYLTRDLTFAHVLNVPVSEDIWPGEAVKLFPQWFFAKSPNTGMFVYQGEVHEHMRRETLRLCSGKYSAKDHMEDELNFYCESENAYFEDFGDRSDDEDELLLTNVIDWDV